MNDFTNDPQFLSELTKAIPDEPVMFAGWRGCVDWASRKPEFVVMFLHDTGAKSFDRNDRASMLAFCDWATSTIWGEDQ